MCLLPVRVLCTSPSIFFSNRRAAYTSLKSRGPAFPPDSSPSFIPFYASHPISVFCRNGIRPSREVDGRLDVIFPFLNEKRKSRDREYGNKREWEEEASRRLWERVIVMYCIRLASSSIVLSFKPENVDRKETNSLTLELRLVALSLFLSFATINSCVLYSPIYERRWICLTFLFPSRQTLDRVRGKTKKNCEYFKLNVERHWKHAVAFNLSRMSSNTPVFMYIYDWTSCVYIFNTYERETTVRETHLLSPPTVHQSFPEFEMPILICFFVYIIHCFWFVMRFCVFFSFFF